MFLTCRPANGGVYRPLRLVVYFEGVLVVLYVVGVNNKAMLLPNRVFLSLEGDNRLLRPEIALAGLANALYFDIDDAVEAHGATLEVPVDGLYHAELNPFVVKFVFGATEVFAVRGEALVYAEFTDFAVELPITGEPFAVGDCVRLRIMRPIQGLTITKEGGDFEFLHT